MLSLDEVKLSVNKLVGPIPSYIGTLTKLRYIDLGFSLLTGTIPSSIGSLISLATIALYVNSLSGTIPSTMSSLTLLKSVSFNYNYLTMGSQPTVPTSTFSSATLNANLSLDNNCLAFTTSFPYPSRSVTATHCRPTSKYQLYNHVIRASHLYLYRIHNSIISADSSLNVHALIQSNECFVDS